MATDAADATRRARNTRRAQCAAGALAVAGHSSAHAGSTAAHFVAAMFVVTSSATLIADASGAPEVLVWIWAALAGTMAGSFAGVMTSLIVSPRTKVTRHLLHLGLAIVAGLIGAPLAAMAWNPEPPKHIPLAVIWFAISGVCAFLAPALAIALHKRSGDIADEVIDHVSTPKQARDQRRTDNDQAGRVRLVPLVLLAGLAALAWFCRDILFLIYIMLTGGFGH